MKQTLALELKVGDSIRGCYCGVIAFSATVTAINMKRVFPFTVRVDEVDPQWIEYTKDFGIEVGETRSLFSAEILEIIT